MPIQQLLALQQALAGSPPRRSRSREKVRRPRSLSASPDRSPAAHYSSSSSSSVKEEEDRCLSPHRRNLFGTDSDSPRPLTPAPEKERALPDPLASLPRGGHVVEEDLTEGKFFYFLTSEASIKDGNLHLPGLPPILASNILLAKERDRQVVKHVPHDSPFEVAEAPQLESFADRMRQPKGFGDESRLPPTSPNIPHHRLPHGANKIR